MILGIEVLCEACGTELEIIDVNTDHLLKVTLKARPCPKCNRPPDCQLSCEDILDKEKELVAFREQVTELEKEVIEKDAELLSQKQKIDIMQEKIGTLSSLIPIDDDDDDDREENLYPDCFGKRIAPKFSTDRCHNCSWAQACQIATNRK